MSMRRGLTLVEILVVIAIIALLMGVLLPALKNARRTAKEVLSLANLRSNSQMQAAYQSDIRGCFYNPFAIGGIPCTNVPHGDSSWIWVPNMRCDRGWDYGQPDSSSGTETFGYHWIAHLLYDQRKEDSRLQSIIAPGDAALMQWFANNRSADGYMEWIFPGSYWYPPVFWQDYARFAGADAHARDDHEPAPDPAQSQ